MEKDEKILVNQPVVIGNIEDDAIPMFGEKGTTCENPEKGTTSESLPFEESENDLPSEENNEDKAQQLVNDLTNLSEAKFLSQEDLTRAQETYSNYCNEYQRTKDEIRHLYENLIQQQAYWINELDIVDNLDARISAMNMLDKIQSSMLVLMKGLTEVG